MSADPQTYTIEADEWLPEIRVDWLLHSYGHKPGEIERRRFLQNHHHLVNPVMYTEPARRYLDQVLLHGGAAYDARNQRLNRQPL